jgi:hypothetical protein
VNFPERKEILKRIFSTLWDFERDNARIVTAGISIEGSGASFGVKSFTAQSNRNNRAESWSKNQ